MTEQLIKEAEIIECDIETDFNWNQKKIINMINSTFGYFTLKETLRELHREHYANLLKMKERYLLKNDELRSKGVSFNERQGKLGKGKLEWIEKRMELTIKQGKELRIPNLNEWVKDDYEVLVKVGLKEWLGNYYRKGIFFLPVADKLPNTRFPNISAFLFNKPKDIQGVEF